ncbi:MAG: hypothetical protein R2819_01045 [Allomuricauda sp.]
MVSLASDYINFWIYCNKRKSFCKGYHRLKKDRFRGYIDQNSYVRSLRKIHRAAIELDLDYFDILHLRL